MKSLIFIMAILFAQLPIFAQISIISTTGTDASCSNNGTASVSISGGNPIFCYQINGGTCQYSASPNYTFTGLYSGNYTITVSDGQSSASQSVNVGGNYMDLNVFANIDGCGITATAWGGLKSYQYAISINGSPYSAPTLDPNFNGIQGDYCVRVYDACNNFTQYCGNIDVQPLDFQVACCNEEAVGGQMCVKIIDLSGNEFGDPAFWIGGLGPYTFSANSNGQNITAPDGTFTLNPQCPGWVFSVTDACGNVQTQTANCTEAEALCINCTEGTAQILGNFGPPPFTFQYQDVNGVWQTNPVGANNGNFSGLPTFPNGTGFTYNFQVIDACGNTSPVINAQCLDANIIFNCGTQEVKLTVQTDFFPATVTCNTCIPNQTFTLQENEEATFTGLLATDEFTITDACGAMIMKNCEEIMPRVKIRRLCNGIKANLKSQYECDFMGPNSVNVIEDVTYTLYLESDQTNPIETNSTGIFDNLTPGETYFVEAFHPNCGLVSSSKTLFDYGDFDLSFELQTTSFIENGICKKGYNLTPILTPDIDLPPIFELIGNGIQTTSGGDFLNVGFGDFILSSPNYCVEIPINLPEWIAEIEVNLPECPNGGCIQLSGIKNADEWTSWGASQGLTITNQSDFYIINCPDFDGQNCIGNWTGEVCNLAPGNSYAVFLRPDAGECPVDTTEFTLEIGGTSYLDSVALTTAVACVVNGMGSLTAQVFGGKDPLVLEVLNSQTGQILQTLNDSDGDHLFEVNNLQSGTNYFFRIIDDCGTTTDAFASVISLPEVEIEVDYLCSNRMKLRTDIIQGAEYFWRNSNGDIIDAGINLWELELPAPTADESFFLEILYENCPSHSTSIVVPFFPEVSVGFPFQDTLICDANNFDLVPQIGIGNYSFEWNDGSINDFINISESGDYEVVVQDEFGCEDTANVEVLFSAPILLDFEITDLKCFGDDNGTVEILPSGGQIPFKFLWENGDTISEISNLSGGVFQLTVSDAVGCIKRDSVTIFEPPILSLETISTDLKCFGDKDGKIETIVNGGIGDYQFLWSNNTQNPTLENLEIGDYSVIVTDENGCEMADTVTIISPTEMVGNLNSENILCHGENTGSIKTNVIGGIPNYTFYGQIMKRLTPFLI